MDLRLSPVSTNSEEIYTPSPQYNPPPPSPLPPSPRKDYHSLRMISPPPLRKMEVGTKREKIDYVKFIEECKPYPSLLIEITGCVIPFVIACILSPFI